MQETLATLESPLDRRLALELVRGIALEPMSSLSDRPDHDTIGLTRRLRDHECTARAHPETLRFTK